MVVTVTLTGGCKQRCFAFIPTALSSLHVVYISTTSCSRRASRVARSEAWAARRHETILTCVGADSQTGRLYHPVPVTGFQNKSPGLCRRQLAGGSIQISLFHMEELKGPRCKIYWHLMLRLSKLIPVLSPVMSG